MESYLKVLEFNLLRATPERKRKGRPENLFGSTEFKKPNCLRAPGELVKIASVLKMILGSSFLKGFYLEPFLKGKVLGRIF